MPVRHLTVGIVAVKRKLSNPWVDFEWMPEAVLPGLPEVPPGTRIGAEGSVERWYLGPVELTFHSGETSHYRDNLASGRPAVWGALREGEDGAWRVAAATIDPYEGEAFVYVDAHHVDQPFYKRKRDRKDPNAEPDFGIGHPALAERGKRS